MEETLPDLSDLKTAEFKEAFDLFDKNGNGRIHYVELGEIFRQVGQNPSDNDLREMIKEADGGSGDELTYDKFIMIMRRKMLENDTEAELIEAFKLFDTEGKGLINNGDLRQMLLNLGETLSSEELDRVIQEADDDNDGYVNYEEFVRTVMNA